MRGLMMLMVEDIQCNSASIVIEDRIESHCITYLCAADGCCAGDDANSPRNYEMILSMTKNIHTRNDGVRHQRRLLAIIDDFFIPLYFIFNFLIIIKIDFI